MNEITADRLLTDSPDEVFAQVMRMVRKYPVALETWLIKDEKEES